MQVIIRFPEVSDSPAYHEFFTQFKEQLKVRFKQIDLQVTFHDVDVIQHNLLISTVRAFDGEHAGGFAGRRRLVNTLWEQPDLATSDVEKG